MANKQNKSSHAGGIDYTDAVIKAVRAGGNPSFASWRNTLIQQGWDADTANSIKYDPVSGRFLSTQKERYMGDMQAPHSGKLTPDEAVMAENGANPGRRLDAVGKSEIPNYSNVSAADEGLAAAVSTVKQVKDALGPDALKKFLAALQLLGFGSGAGNPDTPKPVPEPGMSDFIGNGGTYWDSSAPATGYRPEPKTSDYSVGPSRALRDEIHNAAIRTDQDISGQNWRASK